MNKYGARMLLAMIGGLAASVAGVDGHYIPDHQTPQKKSRRPRNGRGNYGENLRAHFDQKRFAEMKAKKAARAS
jgi:hypothetical protein